MSDLTEPIRRQHPMSAQDKNNAFTSAGGGAVGFFAFIVLALVVPLLLLFPTGTGAASSTQLAVRIVILLYSAISLSILLGRGEPNWFAAAFWSFVYIWMGIAGLAQAIAGRDPFGHSVDSAADEWSAFIVLLGMITWHISYSLASRRQVDFPHSAVKVVSPNRVIVVFLVAIVLTPTLLLYLGDIGLFLLSRQESNEVVGNISDGSSLAAQGIIIALIRVPPALSLFGVTVLLQAHVELRKKPAWWVLAMISFGLNVLVNSPVGVSRFWSGTVIIGWILCWQITRTTRGFRSVLVGIIVALSILFPYADFFRTPDAEIDARSPIEFFVGKLDYDAPAQVTNAISTYQLNGPSNGAQIGSAVLFMIPRSIWEGKADHTGMVIARASGIGFENLSAPLWAEGYIDFGPIGAVTLPAIFGFGAGWCDKLFIRALRGPRASVSLIAFPALALYSIILIRGSLLATISLGVVFALGFFLLGKRVISPDDLINR